MKLRTGFVSNSSASSFVIDKKYLSAHQVYQICNYNHFGEQLGLECADDDFWRIREDDKRIYGDTIMDNFDFYEFLEKIGVQEEHIQKEDGYGYVWDEWDDVDYDKMLEEDDED